VTFKITNEAFYFSKDKSSDEDEESMAMIVHGLKKMFKSKRLSTKKV